MSFFSFLYPEEGEQYAETLVKKEKETIMMNRRVTRVTRSNKTSYLNAITGVEPLSRAVPSSPEPIAPAPTLAQNEAGSEIERSAEDSTSMDSQTSDVEILLTPEEKDKSLLSLRQQYKKAKTNITRATSHLNFLQQCEEQQKTPKGLRVNVKCNALLADYTNVKDQFKTTKDNAEEEFKDYLKEHYDLLTVKLNEDLEMIEANMKSQLEKASPEAKKEHQDLMKKTSDNIAKHEERLQSRKKHKYDLLTDKEGTRQQDRRQNFQRRQDRFNGRGMPYNTRPKRQQRNTTPRPKPPTQPAPMETQPIPPPQFNVAQEMAEMRSLLNKLLLKPPPPPIQQPPQLPGMVNHCPPMVQQHPSLLGPGGNILPGQHPSLVRQGQQYFLPRDRLPPQ